MKQYITQEQYEELSEPAKQAFLTWTFEKSDISRDYSVAYRSIGHLIQFLDEYITHGWWHVEHDGAKQAWRVDAKYLAFHGSEQPELCDALWKAVKLLLESKEPQI